MRIEDQVCTLEQAKKLKELGVTQTCAFHWRIFYHGNFPTTLAFGKIIPKDEAPNVDPYAAFTVAELGVMLPSGFDTMHVTGPDGWRSYDDHGDDYPNDKIYQAEAEARAEMLIHLLRPIEETCKQCLGHGVRPSGSKCLDCRGSGSIWKSSILPVEVNNRLRQ